ncbi:catalase [Altererythrobacter xixiisoli]|uniref:Catalase n=1 Tax=Croceibacterium xixiisoli TaxID=1476466 RepID=A0A6I4TTK8_9SPHN|nr:catalase family protein [Croceibacterium xixiisoli]MXO99515.1 catalase [Croceibacterium xixiisoli]
MSLPPPIRFDPALEQPTEEEASVVADLNESFDEIMETTYRDCGHALRAVHAKSHGVLQGTFVVDSDLPPELAQGAFARPGEHAAYVRLSTNAGDILDDTIALPRGLAMKICDVPGERLPDAEGEAQDFVMVNSPAFAAPDAQSFGKDLKLLAKTTDRVEGLKKVAAGMARAGNAVLEAVGADPSSSLTMLGGMPNVEPLGETYYSAVPFRYGDHVAKFMLRPAAEWMEQLSGETIDPVGRENAIREDVRAEMQRGDAEWEFCVQLLRDPERQPVEDASVEWPRHISPYQRVGLLRVPAQDSWDQAQVQAINEEMRFSPWTGLEAHRPLGQVNRARRDTYRHSADFRARMNLCPMHEPG